MHQHQPWIQTGALRQTSCSAVVVAVTKSDNEKRDLFEFFN